MGHQAEAHPLCVCVCVRGARPTREGGKHDLQVAWGAQPVALRGRRRPGEARRTKDRSGGGGRRGQWVGAGGGGATPQLIEP